MTSEKILFLHAVVLYGVTAGGAYRFWKSGFRDRVFPWALLPVLAFLTHSVAMILRGFSLNKCPINNLFEAGMFIGWVLSLGMVFALTFKRTRFISALLSPLLFLLGAYLLLPALDQPRSESLPHWVSLHATLVFLAYGAWGISAVCSLMYLIQQRELKRRNVRALQNLLPSVMRLQTVPVLILLLGFIFLTIGLVVGIIGHHTATGLWIAGDLKIIWAIVLWGYILVLLFARMRSLLYGRKLAYGIIGGFLFVLLTLWPTSALSTIHGLRDAAKPQSGEVQGS